MNASLFSSTLHKPGALPTNNPVTGLSNLNTPTFYDPSLGRPTRVSQYNVALQREIIRNLTLEAAWVGNRGAWLQGSMYSYNATTPTILAAHGLSLSRPADFTLLNSQIGSTAVKAAGYSLPFANYPSSSTLTTALRPFPEFGTITPTSSIVDSWYDSLQTKLNARLKWNLTALGTYTWSKSMTRISSFNDWTNLSAQKALAVNSIPQALSVNLIYQTPHLMSGPLSGNKVLRQIFSDWQASAVLRYQSGALINAPTSNDNLGTYLAGTATQYMTRVPGQPLYLVDPNSKIDPTKQLILNPQRGRNAVPLRHSVAEHLDIPISGSAAHPRRISESAGDSFYPAAKAASLKFEWRCTTRFNRIVFPAIGVGNPITTPTRNSNGLLTGGFGFMNVNNIVAGTARNMLVVARIAF